MLYGLEDIKRDVRIVLDENQLSDNLMEDIDTLSVDEIIISKIEEAAKTVVLNAPTHWLEPGNNFATSVAWEQEHGKGAGFTVLPDDFLRFISFKMSDWEYPVYEAITPDNPIYKLQRSRAKGIRGNTQRPVCAIVMRPYGRVLEFYSCKGGDDVFVEMAIYAPIPKIVDDSIDIYERCYKSSVYMIAALTAGSMDNHSAKVEYLVNLSNSLLK